MNFPRLRPAVAVLAAICVGAIATVAQADPAGKWRIEFGSRADTDGIIKLRVSPEGGTPVDIETKINSKSSPNRAARTVRDSLRVILGEGYYVDIEHSEDVVIGRLGKTPKFGLTLTGSTVTGLQIRINRE